MTTELCAGLEQVPHCIREEVVALLLHLEEQVRLAVPAAARRCPDYIVVDVGMESPLFMVKESLVVGPTGLWQALQQCTKAASTCLRLTHIATSGS